MWLVGPNGGPVHAFDKAKTSMSWSLCSHRRLGVGYKPDAYASMCGKCKTLVD